MQITFCALIALMSTAAARHIGELVCRKCGALITRQSELLNMTADAKKSEYNYVFPVVGRNTTVNVFKNPAGETFHVLASKTAHLKFHGHASSDATWFAGMQWTICLCQRCNQHMGWYFQPEKPSVLEKDSRSFVGLELSHLISAEYVDSLSKMPV